MLTFGELLLETTIKRLLSRHDGLSNWERGEEFDGLSLLNDKIQARNVSELVAKHS